ncbi:MAG: quinone oxidoreductase family protein [Myxococcaceae bacterium]
MRSHAIRVHAHGSPEVLSFEEVEVQDPGPGEALVRHTAVGLNFVDVYHRTGLYPLSLPGGLGTEAAGVVEKVGAGVSEVAPGDRVAYAGGPQGAYAEARCLPARVLVRLPPAIPEQTAAAMMLKGMTAEYLLRRTRPVQAGETILFHAAAGGVGLIACQWAKHLGAHVIGTVGSRAKAALAERHGCEHVVVTAEEDFVARVKELTSGRGLPVVYDSVGKDTFLKSLECLRPRGMMVSFGQSSGPVAPLEVTMLSARGSLYLTRPSLGVYNATREELVESANALFEVVGTGAVKVEVNQTYPLREAARAHQDLQARRTTGSTVLVP